MSVFKYLVKEFYERTNFSKLYRYENKIIKQIPKLVKNIPYNYKNEYNILKNINDPCIVKIQETYADNDYYYTVMDFYNRGDLYFNMYNKRLSVRDHKKIIRKLIAPIYTIHNMDIIHMDIKLENYVLNNTNDEFVLIDFHLARNHKANYYDLHKTYNIIGTEPFIAPEVYEGWYCKSSDMYSLGCMLYVIYTGRVCKNMDLHLLDNQPNDLQFLIKELINKDYKLRPSIYDLKYYLT